MSNPNFNPTLSSDEIWRGTDSSRCLTDDLDTLGIEDTTYPGCYHRTVNGVTEWINPPLVADVEYRTTERWFGKPVYTRTISTAWQSDGVYTITNFNGATPFKYVGKVGTAVLPFIHSGSLDNDYSMIVAVHKNNNDLKINMYGSTSTSGTLELQLWYTK